MNILAKIAHFLSGSNASVPVLSSDNRVWQLWCFTGHADTLLGEYTDYDAAVRAQDACAFKTNWIQLKGIA